MSRIYAVMCILFVSINSAQAIDCQTSVQGSDSHWAWRLIDGRQCWYKGASGMDKSLLHWSAAKDGPQAMSEARPIPPELLNMLPIMPPQPTFEDRWRLR
jgi:hypothetical protein